MVDLLLDSYNYNLLDYCIERQTKTLKIFGVREKPFGCIKLLIAIFRIVILFVYKYLLFKNCVFKQLDLELYKNLKFGY